MQVIDVSQSTGTKPVPLRNVKSGRTVMFRDPQGVPNYYLTTKWSKLEANNIVLPLDTRMLVNLETGRVVFKADSLLVYLTSCTAESYLRNA